MCKETQKKMDIMTNRKGIENRCKSANTCADSQGESRGTGWNKLLKETIEEHDSEMHMCLESRTSLKTSSWIRESTSQAHWHPPLNAGRQTSFRSGRSIITL